MGSQHKLLLPWDGATIIEHVLQAWSNSQVDRVVLVSRQDDAPLHQVVRSFSNIELVIPDETPADMKRSVLLALQHLEADLPRDLDRWLLAPADLPTIESSLIDQVIARSRETSAIVVPKFAGRRGHPVSFPWSLSGQVGRLADNEGINRLLEQFPVEWLQLNEEQYPDDVDTDDDYQRLRRARDAKTSR